MAIDGKCYDDEDNYPMSEDDRWAKYTGYSCKAEADYYENGGYERDMEAKEAEKDYRESQIKEGFLDDLGFLRGSKCRKCEWMQECVIDQFEDLADDDYVMPGEAYDLAQRMCKVCKTTPEEKRDDALRDFFEKEDQ